MSRDAPKSQSARLNPKSSIDVRQAPASLDPTDLDLRKDPESLIGRKTPLVPLLDLLTDMTTEERGRFLELIRNQWDQ